MKNIFESLRDDEDFYNDKFLNFYEGPEEKAKDWFNHYYNEFMDNINQLTITGNQVKVWRAVTCDSVESINLNAIGASWSYKKDEAHAWYGSGKETFIIEAMISLDAINVETTLRQNLVNPDEYEFRLGEGEEVMITAILDESRQEIKSFSEPIKSSSGKLGAFGDWNE